MAENSQREPARSQSQATWERALVTGFEQAWQSREPPNLGKYLPSEPDRRIAALAALVPIDLEYRWKLADSLDSVAGSLDSTVPPTPANGFPARPRIEDYQRAFPELGPADSQLIDIVAWEYHVRHRWGDQPSQAEYGIRFPDLAEAMPGVLAEIDKQLRAERSHKVHDLATVPPGPAQTAQARDITIGGGTETVPGMRFRILRPHAQGGLGQVSVALDEELQREVALKEIQERHAEHPESRARFVLEAEVTAKLEHPGIVPVHGMGKYADGRPYYAMRFIKGESLKEAIERFHERRGQGTGDREQGREERSQESEIRSQKKPGSNQNARAADFTSLEFRKLLNRFIEVCNAIEYAHSRGVIHRDIKPANIMLGKYGETLVVDWGLAKMVGRGEQHTLADEETLKPATDDGGGGTKMGRAMGTPQYMSPEQAEGRLDAMGPPSDVYSLGATLYSLLTGQSPFASGELWDIVARVAAGEFPAPRQVNRHVPRALEAICLKAMAIKPAHRYASARALADDIEKWLADDAVSAHREPFTKRIARWSRRHRRLTYSLLTFLLIIPSSLGVGLYFAKQEQSRAESARALAELREYHAKIELAHFSLTNGDLRTAELALDACEPSLRGWEHEHLMCRWRASLIRELHDSSTKGLVAVVAHPTEDLVAAVYNDEDQVVVWNSRSGGIEAVVRIRPKPLPREGRATLTNAMTRLAISPDAAFAVVGFINKLYVVDLKRKELVQTLTDGEGGAEVGADMLAVLFAPDGRRMLTVRGDIKGQRLSVWQTSDWSREKQVQIIGKPLSFAADGRTFFVEIATSIAAVDLVSLETKSFFRGRSVFTLVGKDGKEINPDPPYGHEGRVTSLVTLDENRIASASVDGTVRVWNVADAEELSVLQVSSNAIAAIVASPDGSRITAVDADGVISMWEVATEKMLTKMSYKPFTSISLGTKNGVIAGAYEDRILLFSSQVDKPSWQSTSALPSVHFRFPATCTRAATDGCFACSVGGNGGDLGDESVARIDARTGNETWNVPCPHAYGVFFSADGKRTIALGDSLRAFDAASGKLLMESEQLSTPIVSGRGKTFWPRAYWAAIDPSSSFLAAHVGTTALSFPAPGGHGSLRIWNVTSGKRLHEITIGDERQSKSLSLRHFGGGIHGLAFSTDGQRLFASVNDGSLRAWDVETGRQLLSVPTEDSLVDIAPNGNFIVKSPRGEYVIVAWPSLTPLAAVAHDGECTCIAFHLSVDRFVTGGKDARVNVWHAWSGQKMISLQHGKNSIAAVGFSSDGNQLVAIDDKGNVVIWE